MERAFVEAIEALGGDAPKFEVKGRRGYPDRIGLLPGGRVLFCEAKAPGETPRKDQRARIRKLRKLGFVVAVVDTPAKARRAVDRFDFDPPMLHRR